jgi:hypothetical protein
VPITLYDTAGQALAATESGLTGFFQFSGLPDGSYVVAVDGARRGYASEVFDDVACSPTCDVTAGRPLVISGANTVSRADFLLDALGSITGTVRNRVTGRAIPFVPIEIANQAGSVVATTQSGTDGTWVAPTLPAGTYFAFTESLPGFYADALFDGLSCEPSCTPTLGTPIGVTAGQGTTGIDFALGPIAGACAADVAGSVAVTRGGFRYNYGTGQFVQSIAITNVSGVPLYGPLSVVLDGLTPGVSLADASGATSCTVPAARPFLSARPGDDDVMTPGETVTVTLRFVNPSRRAIAYSARVLAGPNTP